ncbi:hypothetical protein X975_21371, partial [Stegodyphus mimosarum]
MLTVPNLHIRLASRISVQAVYHLAKICRTRRCFYTTSQNKVRLFRDRKCNLAKRVRP